MVLDLDWVRVDKEAFLSEINITSWRRHCQAELTRNNIDIANPDCLLTRHITSERSKNKTNSHSLIVSIPIWCRVFVWYFMSLSEEIQLNYEKGSPRGGGIMMTFRHRRGSIILCQLRPRHICHTILSSPSCHNSTHSETETIFHKTHQASCCLKNNNPKVRN